MKLSFHSTNYVNFKGTSNIQPSIHFILPSSSLITTPKGPAEQMSVIDTNGLHTTPSLIGSSIQLSGHNPLTSLHDIDIHVLYFTNLRSSQNQLTHTNQTQALHEGYSPKLSHVSNTIQSILKHASMSHPISI